MMGVFDVGNILFALWGYEVSLLELIGIVTGFCAIFLAGRASIFNFVVGLLNCVVYFTFFYQQHLYSMMLLQIVFACINVYGLYSWRKPKDEQPLAITPLKARERMVLVAVVAIVGALWGGMVVWLSGVCPEVFSLPAYPYIDAVLFVANVAGQLLLARKKIDNWVLWIVVDAASIVLYCVMGIYLTALLYVAYVVISVYALREWRVAMKVENKETTKVLC